MPLSETSFPSLSCKSPERTLVLDGAASLRAGSEARRTEKKGRRNGKDIGLQLLLFKGRGVYREVSGRLALLLYLNPFSTETRFHIHSAYYNMMILYSFTNLCGRLK
ncbi:hypothetical protein E2C01_054297 [Portunus trituberculatus]|uniref:Uncharacterized protein n=1 Tax=Portunus trituberculatus TaxID=210409 RepID=A0A5B7GTC9_PORTR|nr:hypothetical protein [Portunus trituberculatus]